MKPTKSEVDQRVERFEAACRNTGVRLTHQRLEIFREVAKTGDHPDVETVFKRVRKRMPTVSLDTVYRTLWLLNGQGLIKTLGPSRERTRFDANMTRHHHFVCTECGLTRDFYSQELDDLKLPKSVASFDQVETTLIEVRGTCRDCAGHTSAAANAKKEEEDP